MPPRARSPTLAQRPLLLLHERGRPLAVRSAIDITFLLNDRVVTCHAHAAVPLLDAIRGHFGQKATKEGCREGDCGACTVLLGRLREGRVNYQAVTSCLVPIGDVAGLHVVTVEGLHGTTAKPTEVQAALVAELGTQCGFCTPGIVMAMTGFLLSAPHLDADHAKRALAGNICRCTGYAPILRAAMVVAKPLTTSGSPQERLAALTDANAIPAYFSEIPARLAALTPLTHLTQLGIGKRLVAGATDLLVQGPHGLLQHDVVLASQLVDDEIAWRGGDLRIGAGVTMEALTRDPRFGEFVPEIAAFSLRIASLQIRERATLAGNIVNASPIGDFTILLLALDAQLELHGPQGARTLPLDAFHTGYKQMQLAPGEWLHAIALPERQRGRQVAFEKVSKRTHLDIASVNSALAITTQDDRIVEARLAAGGVAAVPKFLRETSEALRGLPLTGETVRLAGQLARAEISPISDVRGSALYKSRLLERQIFAHFATLFGIEEGLP